MSGPVVRAVVTCAFLHNGDSRYWVNHLPDPLRDAHLRNARTVADDEAFAMLFAEESAQRGILTPALRIFSG